MSDQWEFQGSLFVNCSCAFGCPCQFNAPTTHGYCEGVSCAHISTGHFNDTPLDGLGFLILIQWPGEIAEGNGRQQVLIDERANAAQREALKKIAHGEAAAPGSNIFYVYNSTMSEVLETLYLPLEISIDVEGRKAQASCPGLVTSSGSPLINPFTGAESRAGIHLPQGLEYSYAEMGTGSSTSTGDITLELSDSYGQFCYLHWNQDGVIHKNVLAS